MRVEGQDLVNFHLRNLPESISCLPIEIQAEALLKEWLATETLAHHRQQEVSTPRNEADETTMSDGTEIEGMMGGAQGDAVARGASM